MNTWYSKQVPYPSTAAGKAVDEAFRALCAAQGGKARGAAVFSKYDQATQSTTLYFSPEARSIAQQSDAQSCEKPEPLNGFALSIGDPDSWRIHFPAVVRPASQTSRRPLSTPNPGRWR